MTGYLSSSQNAGSDMLSLNMRVVYRAISDGLLLGVL